MAPEYEIRQHDPAGVLQAEITDYLYLAYVKQVNDPGRLSYRLNAAHPAAAMLTDKNQIEVWRRDAALGIAWYCDFYGLYRDPEWETDGDGRNLFTAGCPGQMSMLDWRINAYPTETANKTQFTTVPAETIMKTIVTYNMTASATTGNGRDRNGQITGISVAADAAGGNTLTWQDSRGSVLRNLFELSRVGGGDFDLIKTGAAAWEFRFYPGQRGTDRTATVRFSEPFGNMARPKLTIARSAERTAAIGAGQGETTTRVIAVRTGVDYDASANNIEMLVDARTCTTSAGVQTAADRALDQARARAILTYDVLQVPSTLYGKHYFVGDLVTAYYAGQTFTQQIYGVAISFDKSGKQAISVRLRDV